MSGRHRVRRNLRGAGATAAALALLIVVGGAWVGVRQLAAQHCTGQLRLTVGAAPEIAPALRTAAQRWLAEGAAVGRTCVAVDVSTVDPADVAAAVAGQHGVSLTGLGQASGSTAVPDVWIPDSSMWRLRLQAAASGFQPTDATSIARSPVVLAVPEPVASQLGWPNSAFTWGRLLTRIRTDIRLKIGTVEPTRDAAALTGLLAISQAAGTSGSNAQETTATALRTLALGRSVLRDDLLARFPRSTDPATIATSLSAAPLTEQTVIAYNRAKPPISLAALYVEPAPQSMDYPYIVMPGIEPTKAQAAEGLRGTLKSSFRDTLARHGLRGSDGVGGSGFEAPTGAPNPAGTPSPAEGDADSAANRLDPGAVDRALGAWFALTLPGRMLAVIDVSGSMLTKVPTAGNLTREQVTIEAAQRGLALFDDSWSLGLWTFSTNLDGPRDYRQLLPIAPLATNRGRAVAELNGIRPTKDGNTGLHDTMLAAYRTVQVGWDSDRVNSVVILTDGENQDADGLSLEALLAKLREIRDAKKPINVVFIGIGPDIDPSTLKRITEVTGGGVFTTADPAKIGDIFLKAISLRTQQAK